MDIDQQLKDLASGIPVPELGNPDRSAEIPTAPTIDELTPDFGAPRKRSRSRKRPQPDAQPVISGPIATDAQPLVLSPLEIAQIGKALGVGFRVTFAIVAAKRGNHWQLSEPDERMLGTTWAEALAPWLVTSAKYVPLAIATLATVGVIVPKIDTDAKLHPAPEPIRNADAPRPAAIERPGNATD